MKNIKVSIITVCLNSEKTIRDTIESVLSQTYPNIEYIIIDGGSIDGTIDIIKEYLEIFAGRLSYVSEKDRGIYDAMNKGIKMSTGQVIGIINSDDFYEKDTVAKIADCIDVKKYQVVYGYCNVWDKHQKNRILTRNHYKLNDDMIPHPTCFATRKTYCKYGLFQTRLRIAADYELMLRFRKNGVEFIQIKEVLANFRGGGISSDKRTQFEKVVIKWLYGTKSKFELLKQFVTLLIDGLL